MRTALGAGRPVEQVKERKAQITPGKKVNAAPPMIGGIGADVPLISQECAGDFLGQRRSHAGAATLAVEGVAGNQQCVAQHFAGEAAAVLTAPQAVLGICLQALFPVWIVAGV